MRCTYVTQWADRWNMGMYNTYVCYSGSGQIGMGINILRMYVITVGRRSKAWECNILHYVLTV
jgi:hypothetical protein